MNLFDICERIARVKGQVLVLGLACAVVAVLMTFRVSLSPVALRPKALQIGVAQTQVLVDQGESPLGTATSYLPDLSARAASFAELINSPRIIDPIARAIHVTPAEIGVEEQLLQNVPLSQSYAREQQVGVQLLADQKHYSVVVRNDAGTLALQIFTQASDQRQAIKMANAAARALISFAADLAARQRVPPRAQVVLRQVGPATGGVVDRGVSLGAAIVLTLIFWVLGIVGLLWFQRIRGLRASGERGLSGADSKLNPGPG